MPGEMAEWSIAAVLKTVELRGSGGSNPSLSASGELGKPSEAKMSRDVNLYFFLYIAVCVESLLA